MLSRLSGPQLIELKNSVVEDFTASNWKELGALTNTINEVEKHSRLLRSLEWGDPDYDGLALTFLRKMIGENDENLEVVQKYVAERCTIAGEDVSSDSSGRRKVVFSPEIFELPPVSPEPNLIAIMMPFSLEFAPVFEAVNKAASASGFKCLKADDIWDHSIVIQDIVNLIFRSFIVVCDFSGRNPNVFYEAGIAHTLGKHVVPIAQSENDIPFDLTHHRYLKYLNNEEGRTALIEQLRGRFETLDTKRNESNWL